MSVVRIATAETGGGADRDQLLDQVAAAAEAAAAASVDLLLFPQLTTLPYFPRGAPRTRDHYNQSERGDAQSLAAFRVAAAAGTWICASYYETLAEGVLYCRALVVRPDGTVAGSHRQVHVDGRPGSWETFYLQPGRGGFEVVDTPAGAAGLLLGAEALDPASWAAIAKGGAEIALVGLSEPADGLADVLRQAAAAAAAHELVVLVANRRGEEFGVVYPGGATALSPTGDQLEAVQLEPGLQVFEVTR